MFIRNLTARRYRAPADENDADGSGGASAPLDNARDDIAGAWSKVEAESPEPTPAAEVATESGDRAAARARDDNGRFAPKDAPPPAEPTAAPAPVAPSPVTDPAGTAVDAPSAAETKPPPASWKHEGREVWASVPPAAQAEVMRREQETAQLLQSTADLRRFGEVFGRMVQPHEQMLRGLGTNAMERVGVYLNTERAMTQGTPEQKALTMAQFVQQYGVDIAMLDQALSHVVQGRQPFVQPNQAPGPEQFRDPRLDQYIAEQRQREASQVIHEVSREIDQFWTGKEFRADVEQSMVMLMDGRAAERRYAAQSGVPSPPIMSLDEAYTLACRMNEKVFTIVQSRAAKAAAEKAATDAAKARGAGVGRSGNPSRSSGAASGVGSNDPRDDLVRAWDAAQSR